MINNMEFIPTTMEREIAPNIVFRQKKSWHSGTYAGEGLHIIPNNKCGDRSGCLMQKKYDGVLEITTPPMTVCHRIYWNTKTKKEVSAFLSYPEAMGECDEYFWETLGTADGGDIERFLGDNAEKEMEEKIIIKLTK